jgi:uncharacterized protein YjbI with pentapeptide repeats
MELCTFTKEELTEILRKHVLWLESQDGGERANLRYANLTSADLSSANLRSANLTSADLSSANLTSADLTSADLSYANLTSADLSSANLSSANLSSANLTSAKTAQITGLYYSCYITPDAVRFGCQCHHVDKWESFTDDEFIAMAGKSALKFARSPIFKATLELAKLIQAGES